MQTLIIIIEKIQYNFCLLYSRLKIIINIEITISLLEHPYLVILAEDMVGVSFLYVSIRNLCCFLGGLFNLTCIFPLFLLLYIYNNKSCFVVLDFYNLNIK